MARRAMHYFVPPPTAPEDRIWLSPAAIEFRSAPPDQPEDGQRYIVASPATGDFEGREDDIADRINGAWVFTTPEIGNAIVVTESNGGEVWVFAESGWSGDEPISEINGIPIGTTQPAPGVFTTLVATANTWSQRYFHSQSANNSSGNIDSLTTVSTTVRFHGSNVVLRSVSEPQNPSSPANYRSIVIHGYNASSTTMTLVHEFEGATAQTRIITPSGENVKVAPGEGFSLVYTTSTPTSTRRWVLLGLTADGIREMPKRIVHIADSSEIVVNPENLDIAQIGPVEDNREITLLDGTRHGQLITLEIEQDSGGGNAITFDSVVATAEISDAGALVDTTGGSTAIMLFMWIVGRGWICLSVTNLPEEEV